MMNDETGRWQSHGNRLFIIHHSAFILFPSSLPENVNYAVKSSLLLSFLESVPEVAAKLKEPKSL